MHQSVMLCRHPHEDLCCCATMLLKCTWCCRSLTHESLHRCINMYRPAAQSIWALAPAVQSQSFAAQAQCRTHTTSFVIAVSCCSRLLGAEIHFVVNSWHCIVVLLTLHGCCTHLTSLALIVLLLMPDGCCRACPVSWPQ